MKYWHSVVAGPIVFGLLYFILWSYFSWVSDYGHSISKDTLSKDYKVIRNPKEINFDVFSYYWKECLRDKVIINGNFVYDKRYCHETEDYVEGTDFEKIEILIDEKITDKFGQILIMEDTVKLGKFEINYQRKEALAFTQPRFKIFNGNLYIVYTRDYEIQISIIKKDINGQLTLINHMAIQYETDKLEGLAFHEFDFELVGDRILFVGSNIDHALFSSWDINQVPKVIKFKTIFNEVSTWNQRKVIIKKNKTDLFVIFGISYYLFEPILDERLFFISKYDLSNNQLSKLRSFRDIEIQGYINRESLHIKIDDNEDIYFKSYDGNVYTINYNSLSTVETLAEFTKKKFLNFFKLNQAH